MKRLLTLGCLFLIVFSPVLEAGKKKGGGSRNKKVRQRKQKEKSFLRLAKKLEEEREEENLRQENLRQAKLIIAKKKNPRGRKKRKRSKGKGDGGSVGGVLSFRRSIVSSAKNDPVVKKIMALMVDDLGVENPEENELVNYHRPCRWL